MTRLVLDASVVLKRHLDEDGSEAARRLLARGRRLDVLVPDLLYAEVGNGLWKKVRRGDLSGPVAHRLMRAVRRAPFDVRPAGPLSARALALACETGRTVYDSLYLALALRHRCLLVTADERFLNALRAGPYAAHICWFADAASPEFG